MHDLKNTVQLIGRLGNDPDIKRLESGAVLARISLATTEVYRNQKKEKVESTQWHSLVAWGKTAEYVEKYVSKGDKIGVEGKLINRRWKDKDDNNRYATEVRLNQILFLESKKDAPADESQLGEAPEWLNAGVEQTGEGQAQEGEAETGKADEGKPETGKAEGTKKQGSGKEKPGK